MISAVGAQLDCVAALLAVALLAVALGRAGIATVGVYASTLLICTTACGASLSFLLAGHARPDLMTLPLGLPWLGAHFRLDALSAFFLVVVNLGGAVASLYALGYGRHEHAPQRVLPFYPGVPRRHEPGACWPTTPSPSCVAGSSCRWRPGRW